MDSPFDAPLPASPGERGWTARLRRTARRASGARSIRARIYLTLVTTILLALGGAGLALFFVLGGLQDDLDEARVREIATAWGPALFSGGAESRTLDTLLVNFETAERLTGSIAGEVDVAVLALSEEGEVLRAFEQGDRFLGERLAIAGPAGSGAEDYSEGEAEAPGGSGCGTWRRG